MAEIKYTKGDIFDQVGYGIAFAIDATFSCDAGICKQLDKAYDVGKFLKALPADSLKWEGKGGCVTFNSGAQDLYALIVKSLPQKYPDYKNIEEALGSLAIYIDNKHSVIKPKIAMPKICCGSYDKREWPKVEELIKKAFQNVDCEILIVEKE